MSWRFWWERQWLRIGQLPDAGTTRIELQWIHRNRAALPRLDCRYCYWYHFMSAVDKALEQMRQAPANVRNADLLRICTHFFGPPRHQGGSHAIFKTPWPGDPRVNIQNQSGKAKAYQVRQVLQAIERLGSPQ